MGIESTTYRTSNHPDHNKFVKDPFFDKEDLQRLTDDFLKQLYGDKQSSADMKRKYDRRVKGSNCLSFDEVIQCLGFGARSRNRAMDFLDKWDKEELGGHPIHDKRDPKRIYSSLSSDCFNSISLHNWIKISEYREEHQGNSYHKAIASAAYFGNGIFGSIETALRIPIGFLVGNPLSRLILGAMYLDRIEHNPIIEGVNANIDHCAQATLQSLVSAFTNAHSHTSNMKTAEKIRNLARGKTAVCMDILESEGLMMIERAIIGLVR